MARPPAFVCKHGVPHDPLAACGQCATEESIPEPDQPGESELACAEAAARGLPDGLEFEMLIYDELRFSVGCKIELADFARARASSDNPNIDHSMKAWGHAAKWADTAAKQAKILAAFILNRERGAAADRADKADAKREGR